MCKGHLSQSPQFSHPSQYSPEHSQGWPREREQGLLTCEGRVLPTVFTIFPTQTHAISLSGRCTVSSLEMSSRCAAEILLSESTTHSPGHLLPERLSPQVAHIQLPERGATVDTGGNYLSPHTAGPPALALIGSALGLNPSL